MSQFLSQSIYHSLYHSLFTTLKSPFFAGSSSHISTNPCMRSFLLTSSLNSLIRLSRMFIFFSSLSKWHWNFTWSSFLFCLSSASCFFKLVNSWLSVYVSMVLCESIISIFSTSAMTSYLFSVVPGIYKSFALLLPLHVTMYGFVETIKYDEESLVPSSSSLCILYVFKCLCRDLKHLALKLHREQ